MDIVAKLVALGLEITSGYGNKTVYGPKSDCSYYNDISKRTENKFVKSIQMIFFRQRKILAPIDQLFVSNAKTVIGHTI